MTTNGPAQIASYNRSVGRTLMAAASIGFIGVVVATILWIYHTNEISNRSSYNSDGHRVEGFVLFLSAVFFSVVFGYGFGLERFGRLLAARLSARLLLVNVAIWSVPLLWGLFSVALLLSYRHGYFLEPVWLSRALAGIALLASAVALCLTGRDYRSYSAAGSSGSLSLTPRYRS